MKMLRMNKDIQMSSKAFRSITPVRNKKTGVVATMMNKCHECFCYRLLAIDLFINFFCNLLVPTLQMHCETSNTALSIPKLAVSPLDCHLKEIHKSVAVPMLQILHSCRSGFSQAT